MKTKTPAKKRAPAAKPRARTAAARAVGRTRAAAAKPAPATAKKKVPAAPRRLAAPRAAAPPAPPRLQRAIFIDVENTSSEADLLDVLNALQIDRRSQSVELFAVGNWRAVGQRLGRRLAGLGAQLVHSAPALGVRDWSDLWIAVAAGCWLGQAQTGQMLDIVSNDRAFDAVGDAAAARGVTFRRLQHRRGAASHASAAAKEEEPERPARRSRRGGRRRRRRPETAAPAHAAPAPARPHDAPAPPARAAHADDLEPHGASRNQIVSAIGRLSGGDAARWVNLDVLEKALKTEGFARPPGSPRLVTRLRMLKDVEVDSHGRVRLAPGTTPPEPPAEPALPEAAAEGAAAEAPPAKKRRSRRKSTAKKQAAAESDAAEPVAEA